jgi:hypothetical protein
VPAPSRPLATAPRRRRDDERGVLTARVGAAVGGVRLAGLASRVTTTRLGVLPAATLDLVLLVRRLSSPGLTRPR